MLVRVGRVVLLGHVVAEEAVGERLEAVRVVAGDVDGDRVVVADVLGERLAGLAVEDDDARHPLQAREEVVLAALVVVEAADHALRARSETFVWRIGFGSATRAAELAEPAALVLEALQRDHSDAVDHASSCSRRSRARSR